ncbi:Protein of unknown function [Flavobacteriaceae bacterium MAR_2010_188]|nr:Protein of unknown function [Flavobacteriaceae bacterium MAR_2010_188]
MKKILLFTAIVAMSFTGIAQINTPAASPTAEMEQKVGLTDVTIKYSRPSMKGRTVMGNLVPYDKIWRTGANQNTMITFGDDVMIGGSTVKAGTYAIFTKPGQTKWDVYFYTDTENWGAPAEWDESKVAAKVTADVTKLPMNVETFTISLDNLTNDSAILGMMWENAYVPVKITTMTDKMVTSSIEKVMNGPSAGDYYAAAVYYMDANKDIAKAEKWMDKAMEMTPEPAFYQLRQQSLIYAKAGKKDKAIETAKKSLAASKAANNMDYVKMNEDSLKEWGAM